MRTQDKAQEQAFYDTYGEAITDPFPDAIYARWFQAGAIPSTGSGAVLDAGTGAGHFGWRLAQAGFRVTGVDLSPRMTARANRGAPAGFRAVAGDLEDARLFAPASFDGIVFGQVLHHFPHPEPVLRNCARWLKPDGWIVIVEPNGANPVNRLGKAAGSVLRRFPRFQQSMGTVNEVHVTPWQLSRRLRRCGFGAVSLALLGDLGAAAAEHQSAPGLMGRLCRLRDGMYVAAWRCLPKPLGCTTLIARAGRLDGS